MEIRVHIRPCRPGEEAALFEVFHSAVHRVASKDYTPEQIQSWAPRNLDKTQWENRIRSIQPFVAEWSGALVGYADLQPTGYIDHFFVSGDHPRRGIGTQLMHHLLDQARARHLPELTSDVSRTAQPFYERFGFAVVEQRTPSLSGVIIPNAFMRRTLP